MLSTFALKMEKEYLKMGQDAEFATGGYDRSIFRLAAKKI
jgi:hypothetical protein